MHTLIDRVREGVRDRLIGRKRPQAVDPTGPGKPLYGETCNGCGLCCVATPCPFALWFVPGNEDGRPCTALEWEGGRAWCGLVRRPFHHAPDLLDHPFGMVAFLRAGGDREQIGAVFRDDLGKGTCDAGPEGGCGPDEEHGMTAAQFLGGA